MTSGEKLCQRSVLIRDEVDSLESEKNIFQLKFSHISNHIYHDSFAGTVNGGKGKKLALNVRHSHLLHIFFQQTKSFLLHKF